MYFLPKLCRKRLRFDLPQLWWRISKTPQKNNRGIMSMKICLYRIAFLMTTLMVFKSYDAVIFESLLNTGDIYFDKHLTKTLINCCVGLIALKMINLSGHQHTIGLKGRNIFAFHWAMFPLTYAIFINLVGMDSIASISTNHLFILLASK